MELALNLVCLSLACPSVLLWIVWRRSSDSSVVPELGRGLIVIGCILTVAVPALSITDDLAHTPLLAEGSKFQDALKAPEHINQSFPTVMVIQATFLARRVVLWGEAACPPRVPYQLLCSGTHIENRPPPYYFL